MKTPTLFEGILVAVISSFVGSLGYWILSALFANSLLIKLMISGLTLAYLLYLLSRSKDRVGRVSVVTLWSLMTISLWLFWPSITIFILFNLIAIWLVRSLYFYSSLFSSLADLALNGASVAIALGAASHTGSLFLTLWCFFLSQALFVLIPNTIQQKTTHLFAIIDNDADFNRAYQSAEAAVRKLSINQ